MLASMTSAQLTEWEAHFRNKAEDEKRAALEARTKAGMTQAKNLRPRGK